MRNLAVQQTSGLFSFSVVVVDSIATGPAEQTVMRLRAELGLDMTYAIEPEHTIPKTRNRALTLARGNYIGIVDDDEFPPADWLLTMYLAIQTFGVDGCLGPVYPFFEREPPKWLVRSRLCERPVHRTGSLLRWSQTRSGNVLLKREVFDKHNLSFDTRFKTGGSDREFFKQAIRAGCKFVAVAEAPVYEVVPPERWTRVYYLRRAVVNGTNAFKIQTDEKRGLSRLVMLLKAVGAVGVYTLALPFCGCAGTHHLVKCLEKGAHHVGWLLSAVGIGIVRTRDF